ncbi:phospho-sugar mutase [Enterococcus casseliflavus]|uniref:phospho-sugar mutase n=1 Tax=Enterococcus casseliflavus TaxID=37734 RepID=UPI003D111F34
MNYKDYYNEWLNSSVFDDDTKKELLQLENNQDEIEDRFFKDLDFGTGGVRALMGAGRNRLNRYTVRRITFGYGKYLLNEFGKNMVKQRGVVIAYDMRHNSKSFAEDICQILDLLNIPTFIFDKITPTPELSFAVTHLNAIGGIVITASHNPPSYNGYKIYDENGCQVIPSIANKIKEFIDGVDSYDFPKKLDSKNSNMIWLDESIDKAFIDKQKESLINPNIIKKMSDKIKILYTPLHGSGKVTILRGLEEVGFKQIYTVKEQLAEDPDFKTVNSPNPEEFSAFKLALEEANLNDVDLIMATDPDADRIGVVVKNNKEYISLSGNQIGALLIQYILENSRELERKKSPYICTTIVTSDLGAKIARNFNVETIYTLTGFKYIGNKIKEMYQHQDFIMGYEESFGFLLNNVARDKDAVGSSIIISEMTAYYLDKGKTLIDKLNEIYIKYGYHKEKLISKKYLGIEGMNKINEIMNSFRLIENSSEKLGIDRVDDYLNGIFNLPASDVVKITLDTGSWFAVRPSGTEPKVKFYLNAVGENELQADHEILRMENIISTINKS